MTHRPILLIRLLIVLAALMPCSIATAADGMVLSSARYSWGRPVEMWMVSERGTGKYTNFERTGDGTKSTTMAFTVTPAQFAELQASLKPVSRWIGRNIPCGKAPIMDGPRANVVFDHDGKPQQVNMDYGCQSKANGKVLVAVGKANALIRTWAKSGKEVAFDHPLP